MPYPVQLDDVEILMEFITLADGTGAPRLAQTRPDRDLLETLLGRSSPRRCG